MSWIAKLYGTQARAARSLMWIVTIAFWGMGIVRDGVSDSQVLSTLLLIFMLALIWPTFIAVPIKRFHDMNRSWWWVIVFLLPSVLSLGIFIPLDVAVTGRLVDMTWTEVLQHPEKYVAAIESLNQGREPDDLIKPLGGIGWGGFSLALIFLIIQFGWLHFVPGTQDTNRFGPPAAQPTPSRDRR